MAALAAWLRWPCWLLAWSDIFAYLRNETETVHSEPARLRQFDHCPLSRVPHSIQLKGWAARVLNVSFPDGFKALGFEAGSH